MRSARSQAGLAASPSARFRRHENTRHAYSAHTVTQKTAHEYMRICTDMFAI